MIKTTFDIKTKQKVYAIIKQDQSITLTTSITQAIRLIQDYCN